MSNDEMTFLTAIRGNPADDLPRLIYADWLDEHGHAQKAEYLRLVTEMHRLFNRLDEVRDGLSVGWTAEVTPYCRVVLLRVPERQNIDDAAHVIRRETGCTQQQAEAIVGSAPAIVAELMPFDAAVRLFRELSAFAEVAIRGTPR